ncbi:ATP-binding protein [Streptosporangium sp. NBC_01755]|uniref:ATP-binding protein n=1 Tax=Streptosporangium sp. NBC_01755 TaxID=2975949 RepID=UPI002DD9FBA4|nr:ATP-binding protein [Streptosporangium sp. NBC_01755]WSD01100.1 ATP-binding protein [Streptosporangium sp. NBC_01755]
MLSAEHAEELRRALVALEAVVALRLEERCAYAIRTSDPRQAGQALLGRPLGLPGTEGIPGTGAYAGDGPLATLVRQCPLSAAEALTVVAAVAPEIDEKFAVYYSLLSDRPGVAHLTGEVVRTLTARTFPGRLAASELLGPHGRLRGMRLIEMDAVDAGPLVGQVRPHRDLVALLTGGTRAEPELSAGFPATRLQTAHTMADLIVSAEARRQLTAALDRIRHAGRVLDDWGFARRHDGVRGTLILFHGPPGTGKSMAAAVLARTAGRPAYRVDLAALVSKYIGETEKNLAGVFDRAEEEDCILVFDEADAVFGRRTEVSDARDRYANQEVSYLLQRVERHRGVVILTTNLLGNLDSAFARRIDLQVEFPAPGVAERLALWRAVLPAALPVADGVDFAGLAERYALTGAEIRDAALDAAYLAAANGQVVTAGYLVSGIRAAFAKSGRTPPPGKG